MKNLKLISALCILHFAFCIHSGAQSFIQFDTTFTPAGYPEGPLLGVLYIPSNPNGSGVVVAHTSGGDRFQLHLWDSTLAANGYVVLSVDYYDLFQPGLCIYPGPPRAFKTATEFLRRNAFQFGCYTKKIAGLGQSGGAKGFSEMITWDNDDSFFQTDLNVNDHLDAAVLYYSWYDNKHYLNSIFDLNWIMKDYYPNNNLQNKKGNPIENIGNITSPVLMFHGTADEAIQSEQSIQFHDSCIAHGKSCELIIFPGAPHSFDYPFDSVTFRDRSQFNSLGLTARDTTLAFFQRNLNPYSNNCAQTKTFWKNNLNQWSSYSLPMMLGTSVYYNSTQLLSILNTSPGNDMSRKLAQQLIAAKLNAMNGANASQIISTITASDNLIGTRTIPIVPKITTSSAEGQQMNSLANTLESFNNGSFNTNCNARLSAIEVNNTTTINSLEVYPNPISNSTNISFSLSQSQNVSLKIFDVSGRLVSTLADKIYDEGENELVWNAENVNAGVYFLQFQSAENSQTEKLMVTK